MNKLTNRLNLFRNRVRRYLKLNDKQYNELIVVSNRFKELPNAEELYSEVFKQPSHWKTLEDLLTTIENAIKSHSKDKSVYNDLQKIEMGSIDDIDGDDDNITDKKMTRYQKYDKGHVFPLRVNKQIYDKFNRTAKEYRYRPKELVNIFMSVFAEEPDKRDVFIDLMLKRDYKKYLKAALED
jgi:hypothetical protein